MSDLFTQELTLVTEMDQILDITLKAKQIMPAIDWVFTQKKREYLEALLNLKNHSSIQVRRKVAKNISNLATKNELPALIQWQQTESDRLALLDIQAAIYKLELRDVDLNVSEKIYSVSEALGFVRSMLVGLEMQIEGEITEVGLFHQLYYFSLTGDNEVLRCQILPWKVDALGIPLNQGLAVRLLGVFRLSKNSTLRFEVKKIWLTGEGELYRNFVILKNKLEAEGLLDESRKRKPADFPSNVLLISSSVSAATGDYIKVLNERISGINVHLLPIKTQGVGAEYSILEALSKVNNLVEKLNIDTIVLTRGGGSKDDLMVFNSESIARTLYNLPKPVIVAIGHEKDVTLAELVADLRCSTPSQAAEKTSLSKQVIIADKNLVISNILKNFNFRISQYLAFKQQIQTRINYKFGENIKNYLHINQQIKQALFTQLGKYKNYSTEIINLVINHFKNRLFLAQNMVLDNSKVKQNLFLKIQNIKQTLDWNNKETRLVFNNHLQNYKNQLSEILQSINDNSPQKILEKGYALVYQNKKIVKSVKNLDINKPLELQFFDGKTTSEGKTKIL